MVGEQHPTSSAHLGVLSSGACSEQKKRNAIKLWLWWEKKKTQGNVDSAEAKERIKAKGRA